MNQQFFAQCCKEMMGVTRERLGIGTYQEKTVHAVVKNYMESDKTKQEKKVGSFVADICNEQGIIEIQTANFQAMRKKLSVFLKDHSVTIVYPIPFKKNLIWIDPETGEVAERRKSPKKGTPQMIFRELYKIRSFLTDENLRISILMIHMEEYKLLDGYGKNKKNYASKYDRIPLALEDEIVIEDKESYQKLLPQGLSKTYTTKEFAQKAGITVNDAQKALLLLYEFGIVERIGKEKQAYLYQNVI